MPIVSHEPFEPINQRLYTGQKLGVQLPDGTVDEIPANRIEEVLIRTDQHFPDACCRILDVAPISRLPIVVME